jgi:hypothetical protein
MSRRPLGCRHATAAEITGTDRRLSRRAPAPRLADLARVAKAAAIIGSDLHSSFVMSRRWRSHRSTSTAAGHTDHRAPSTSTAGGRCRPTATGHTDHRVPSTADGPHALHSVRVRSSPNNGPSARRSAPAPAAGPPVHELTRVEGRHRPLGIPGEGKERAPAEA